MYILSRPQNFAKSPLHICLQYIQTKVRWRFRKILWPSQNMWTLTGHVIYNPAYIYKFQLKTTFVHYWNFVRCWNFDCWNFDYWNFDSLNFIIVCTFLLSYFYWFYMEILTLQIQTLEYMRLRFVLKLSKCVFDFFLYFHKLQVS